VKSTGISTLTGSGLTDPKPYVTRIGAEISAGISTSGRAGISRFFSAELRPSRVCDLRAMVLVGSARHVGRTRRVGHWLSLSGRRYGNLTR